MIDGADDDAGAVDDGNDGGVMGAYLRRCDGVTLGVDGRRRWPKHAVLLEQIGHTGGRTGPFIADPDGTAAAAADATSIACF